MNSSCGCIIGTVLLSQTVQGSWWTDCLSSQRLTTPTTTISLQKTFSLSRKHTTVLSTQVVVTRPLGTNNLWSLTSTVTRPYTSESSLDGFIVMNPYRSSSVVIHWSESFSLPQGIKCVWLNGGRQEGTEVITGR